MRIPILILFAASLLPVRAAEDFQPLPGLTPRQKQGFERGKRLFALKWLPATGPKGSRDGLGPFFHADSCLACHPGGGRGNLPKDSAGSTVSGLLFRVATPEDEDVDEVGGQLAPFAVTGMKPEGFIQTTWQEISTTLADGTHVALHKPTYAPTGWNYGKPPADLRISPRMANPLFGLGLLAAIPEAELVKLADQADANHDGISGRSNEESTWDGSDPSKFIPARFGWKGWLPTLRRQVSAALYNDMGLTSEFHDLPSMDIPEMETVPRGGHGATTEASDADVQDLVTFVRFLAPPPEPDFTAPAMVQGSALFASTGCAACHVPEWKTGPSVEAPALHLKTIHPHTDLLIHDMGPDLADGRAESEATGREWRTAPLWGLHGTPKARLLHDGRADSVTEAILWHDGEAASAKEKFRNLSTTDRAALLAYLAQL